MLFKKPTVQEVSTPPSYFPPDFHAYWNDLQSPRAIQKEMAALLLADLRETGPSWPTERFEALRGLLIALDKKS